jgi:DNA-binding CsgD family transcriptional regulator/tetratricopeptide (TPR) repeat protein
VCGGNGIEPGDVLGLLAQLVEKSLVAAEAVSGGIGEMRYRFLEPTRQYAFQRLAASGELGVVERQHTAYYRGLATEGDEHWRGPWELVWLARLDQDLDNIRSAVKHTLADGDAEAFVRMGIRMCRFWEVRGYTEEGARWLDEALARAAAWPASVQMHVVRQAMFLEWLRGGFERAELLSGQYLNLAQELGDEVRVNNARFFAALFLWMNHGTVDGPLATLEESLAFWRMWREREKVNIAMRQAQAEAAGAALWDNMFLGHALTTLGWLHLERGELEDAQAFFDESVSNARSGGDATQEAWGLAGQALVAHSRGDQQDATRLGRQALAAVRRLGDKGSIRFCLDLLGVVAASHGQVERAGRLFGAAQTVYETTHAWPIGLNYRALYAQHERVVAAMRAGANAASFSAAWERGRRLPLHEATAYAMSDEEPKVSGTEAAGGSIGAGPLSPREREVVALVARGLSNREIAAQLVITERTAGAHVEHILDKLGFASRTQIGVWAAEHGLVTSRPERRRAAGLADWEISQ